jgi:PqqD family protein of HPr-rel-A system
MGPSPNWRVPPDSVFHWREWDAEYVVYHENSGDTHRLNAVGARALKCLIDRPMAVPELTGRVADELGLARSADFSATIDDLLARLRDLGLIEPAH